MEIIQDRSIAQDAPKRELLKLALGVDQELLDRFESESGVLSASGSSWSNETWSGDTWRDSHRP